MTIKERWNEKEIKYKIYESYPFRTRILLVLLLPILLNVLFLMIAVDYIDLYGNDTWFILISMVMFLLFVLSGIGMIIFFIIDLCTKRINYILKKGPIEELDIKILDKYLEE